MMKIALISTVISICSMGAFIFFKGESSTFVYVNNARILSEYEGFKESKIEATNKAEKWKSEVDSAKMAFLQYRNSFGERALDDKEKQTIELRYKHILNLEQEVVKRIQTLEEKSMQEVIIQIDNHMKQFGELNAYEMIFGVNDSGNLLYAKEGGILQMKYLLI